MALSSEDHKDVKGALGKALANKVSKVTRDSNFKNPYPKGSMAYNEANKKGSSYRKSAESFNSRVAANKKEGSIRRGEAGMNYHM